MKQKAIYSLALAAVAMCAINTPLRAAESDSQIEAAFKETYVYRTYLKDDNVKAEVTDGVVLLTGTVTEESRKALAVETAANLPGVSRVDSELATEAEVDAENADTWIGRKVKLALLFRRNVNGRKTAVEVEDGIVTLTGEASSTAQKDLTAEYAKDIEGVKEVKNEMTVAETPEKEARTAGEKIDDASITAQVKAALLMHRSTSSVKTEVQARDGEVNLTGIAQNAAEKALITKLVAGIQGVTSVNNEMTIE